MIINLLKHLITLTIGLLLGYLIFNQTEQNRESDISSEESLNPPAQETKNLQNQSASEKPDPSQVKTSIERIVVKDTSNIDLLKKVIAEKNAEIVSLQNKLNATKVEKGEESDKKDGLKVMTMNDFENQMKGQFMNRFKGVAIKISGDQLNSIKKSFEQNQEKGDWNATYENNITDFIQQADPNGLHFVDELTCNRSMCRLSVNSADTSNWQKLYLSMTEQNWYKSMTLTEESDNPNRMIYYITQPSLGTE